MRPDFRQEPAFTLDTLGKSRPHNSIDEIELWNLVND
jgi:hypothetical protein